MEGPGLSTHRIAPTACRRGTSLPTGRLREAENIPADQAPQDPPTRTDRTPLHVGLTVLGDPAVAIAVGRALAGFVFMKRMAETTSIEAIGLELRDQPDPADEARATMR